MKAWRSHGHRAQVPVLSPWYVLLVAAGLGSTLAMIRALGPFLGWAPDSSEPARLVLKAAALLWLPVTFPWLLLVLAGAGAVWVGWMALRRPDHLATLLEVPGTAVFGSGMAARWAPVLQDLWRGTYQQLPPDLLGPGTALLAGFHLVLVFLAARRPALALMPPVTGGLILLLAWFYGDLPRPQGPLAAYLVLAFAFAALARAAAAAPGSRHPVPGRLVLPAAVQALALVLIAALLAGALPSLDEPAADWVAVTSVANRLLPFTVADRAGGWGAIPGAGGGFQVPTRQFLGGPFFPGATPLLTVELSGDAIPATVYLRGATRLTYDGRSWGPPVDVPWYSRQGVSLWLAAGGEGGAAWYTANGYGDPSAPVPAMREARLLVQAITPHQPVHPYLYAAFEAREVQDGAPLGQGPQPGLDAGRDGRNPVMRTADDTLVVLHPQAGTYTVRSLVPQIDPGAARRAAAAAEARNPAWRDDPALQPYLALPPELPRRVRDLAAQITAEFDNPYDRARAIERYLRGFRYDLNMPFLPAGRDFVDYFLFDLQRGYCVAFASAAVVLLRSGGLAARWVEGFVVPTGGRPGTYVVTYAQAHSWPEVLIPGYGWIPLEPTPAYPEGPLLAAPANPPGSEPDAPAGDGPAPPVPSPRPRAAAEPEDPSSRPEPAEGGGAGATGGAGPAAVAGMVVAAAILAAAAAVLLERRRRRRSLPADPALAARAVFVRVERWLDRLGHGRPPALTAREYARWLARRVPELAPAWERLAALYELARYAPGPGTSEAAGSGGPQAWAGPGGGRTSLDPAAGTPALTAESVREAARSLRRDLERHFGWRFRRVLLTPDPAVVLAAVARWAQAVRNGLAARFGGRRPALRSGGTGRHRPSLRGRRPPAAGPGGRFVRTAGPAGGSR
ncbi:transglutaminase domain-containing protein [Thermaerobacter marianensis DSM 12885]|uniref:Transglutaminase domain-containing protein n=1 Tax=Thermaerobacter marianensis (strain ATCC 700841 / DSM 12885 / JCM 10246 / 7p75a) TaxID=644966 RepID=E6SMJ8_THEM7|nr:transglutaminase domain-containing protein [Thermaerobacter marianensis]ADU50458.1 transglutaminase domain-containing protein [Thermaerobacter marianensis DSM 12885]